MSNAEVRCSNCGRTEYYEYGGGGGMEPVTSRIHGRPVCGPCMRMLSPISTHKGHYGEEKAMLRSCLTWRERRALRALVRAKRRVLRIWLEEHPVPKGS